MKTTIVAILLGTFFIAAAVAAPVATAPEGSYSAFPEWAQKAFDGQNNGN